MAASIEAVARRRLMPALDLFIRILVLGGRRLVGSCRAAPLHAASQGANHDFRPLRRVDDESLEHRARRGAAPLLFVGSRPRVRATIKTAARREGQGTNLGIRQCI